MSQGITYETALALKKAGFPQTEDKYCRCRFLTDEQKDGVPVIYDCKTERVSKPSLSELIEACSYHFETLTAMAAASAPWCVNFDSNLEPETKGKTPEEAVAKLWLALHPITHL